jgi:hypothetical protein
MCLAISKTSHIIHQDENIWVAIPESYWQSLWLSIKKSFCIRPLYVSYLSTSIALTNNSISLPTQISNTGIVPSGKLTYFLKNNLGKYWRL